MASVTTSFYGFLSRWPFLQGFLSDPGPIIVYPCQWLTHSLTNELVEDWMNWPKYADHADQADYAEYAGYAEYSEYSEYAEYAEYAGYAEYAEYTEDAV